MKLVYSCLSLIFAISAAQAEEIMPNRPDLSSPAALSTSVDRSQDTDIVLQQGKQLYESGQYMAALDKFMKVLRRDPREPEAREYLRLVVDELRNKRQGKDAKPAQAVDVQTAPLETIPQTMLTTPRSVSVDPVAQDKMMQQKRTRQLLTTDLSVMAGVKVFTNKNDAHVEMDSALLFADKTGGLREEGVPLLDRVAAWLKSFGQLPVAIHCYPEENADMALGGSLFLHRYAQLYGYFVDERKMPATRFIATNFMSENPKDAKRRAGDPVPDPMAEAKPRVVIIVIGGADELLSSSSMAGSPSRWLEFSIMAPRQSFNPDEGAWATLDLAALTPKQVKSWRFTISPQPSKAGQRPEPIYAIEGKGNLLRRVTWDGRRQKEGTFVAAGTYVCKLVATNADGTDKSEMLAIKVERNQSVRVVSLKPKKPAASPKPKPQPKPAVPAPPAATENKSSVLDPADLNDPSLAEPVAKTPPAPEPETPDTAAAPAAPAASPVSEPEEEDSSSNAIWKQVIQFDTNESDLKPTLKASLERIGKTLEVYPLQKVRVLGFATGGESNPAQLAKQRAERVRQTLVSEYGVDPNRVIVAGGKVGSASKVEISITN